MRLLLYSVCLSLHEKKKKNVGLIVNPTSSQTHKSYRFQFPCLQILPVSPVKTARQPQCQKGNYIIVMFSLKPEKIFMDFGD